MNPRNPIAVFIKKPAAFLFPLLVAGGIGIVHAQAQTQVVEGAQQFAEFGDFKLQSGGVIHDFRLGYRTLGKLHAEKSNAILWPTWLGGTSEQLLQFIGPGKVVDSGKYFVVLVDAIGNGVTASPSNSKTQPLMKFPQFTIRDMVEAEHRLAAQVLHLAHLRAVMGVSMGGMQTFTWALAYPDFMDLVIPILGSPQSTSYDKLLWTAQIDAIELDPAWNHGNPTGPLTRGFAISEEIGQMNITSPAYLVAHTRTMEFDAYLAELRKNAKGDGGTASNQIRQREAIIALDIPKELGVTLGEAGARKTARGCFSARSPGESGSRDAVCRGSGCSRGDAKLRLRASGQFLYFGGTGGRAVSCGSVIGSQRNVAGSTQPLMDLRHRGWLNCIVGTRPKIS